MTRGTMFHGALLFVALGAAWQTWTRDKTVKPRTGDVIVWKGAPSDVKGIVYHSEAPMVKDVAVERRGGYLWAIVTTVEKPAKPPPKPPADGADPATQPMQEEPEPQPITRRQEFLVGAEGEKLFEKLAPLRALRDAGTLDEAHKGEYGLTDPKDKLIVKLASGDRELLVGGKVYGSEDRYVMDPATKRVWVVSAEVWRPLTSHTLLKDGRLHAFGADDVAQVTVSWGDKQRTMLRKKPAVGSKPVWTDAGKPDEPDQTLANFMERVEQLTVQEYVPDQTEEGLTRVATFEYRNAKGEVIGRTELFKRPSATPPPAGAAAAPQFDWFVRTERAPVFARLYASVAQRVEQDLTSAL